nr:MAG TPA: Receptor Binding Protein [Bacteriophage sp.]
MREAETLTLALADGQRPRIDRIVLRFDAASRKSSLLILQGTPDTQPTAPAISRTATVYDLCLADVTRPAGSTSITAAHIKDTRTNEALCGIMRDAVTRIPTEQLDAEARARIDEMQRRADKIIRNYSGGYIGRYELTLQPTGWKTASGSTGYGYQYDATLADATTDHVPFASIALGSQAVAIEAQVATVCDAYDGYIRFAAKRVPTTAIVLDVTLLGPGGPLDVATALLGEAVCGNAICGM